MGMFMLALIHPVSGPWLQACRANNLSPFSPRCHICIAAAVGTLYAQQPSCVTSTLGFVAQTYFEQEKIAISSKAGECCPQPSNYK